MNRLQLQLGIIYTKRKADAEGIGRNTQNLIGKYPSAGSMLNPSINSTDYQAVLFYKPNDIDIFRFAIGKKTRFPSFKESYSNYGDNEKNTQAELLVVPQGSYILVFLYKTPG